MNKHIITAAMFAALSSSSAQALEHITWAGELRDGAAPVNRLVSAIFVVKDGTATVSQLEEASFDVTEGNIVVDLEVNDSDSLTLEVLINGELLGPMPLRTVWSAVAIADSATFSDLADEANAVGDITQPLTKTALATAGQAPVPVGNIFEFPEQFLDGDQGVDFNPDAANFTFVNGVLSLKDGSITSAQLTSISAADVAPGAVTAAKVADGSLTTSDFTGTLPLDRLAPATLTARHFGAAATRTQMYKVSAANCDLRQGTITPDPTCQFTSTTSCTTSQGFPGKRDCVGNCFVPTVSPCANTPYGALVFK